MNYRWLLYCIVCISLTSFLSAGDDDKEKEIKNAISNLIEGPPPDSVKKNLFLLERSGESAFPILIATLEDNRRASSSLQEARMIRQENGEDPKLYITEVGDVALSLLRSKIEGDRPRFYYSFYVLNRTNIKKWLAERSGKSLTEIRVDAAKQALQAVRNTYAKSNSEVAIQTISIFNKRISEIENGASPDIK